MGLKSYGNNAATAAPAIPLTQAAVLPFSGNLKSALMNSTSDQPIAIAIPAGAVAYYIDRIVVTNASTSLTTAAGGIYTATAKGGTIIVAAAQTYAALTNGAKTLVLTLNNTDRRTEAILYLSLTTGQGVAATADFYVEIWPLT
jgi:hypothetical protein